MLTFTHLCHLWISPVSDNLIYVDCSSKWPQKFPLLSTAPAGQSAAHYDTVRQRRLFFPGRAKPGHLPSLTLQGRVPGGSRLVVSFCVSCTMSWFFLYAHEFYKTVCPRNHEHSSRQSRQFMPHQKGFR